MRRLPFDLGAWKMKPNWHKEFCWPLRFHDVSNSLGAQLDRFVRFVSELENIDERHAVLLIGPLLLTTSASFLEMGLYLQAATSGGIEFDGGPEEIEFFRGGLDIHSLPSARTVAKSGIGARPHLAGLRNFKISASWYSWTAPYHLLRAGPVSIANIPLVREMAPRNGARFQYPEGMLDLTGIPEDQAVSFDIFSLSKRLAKELADAPELGDPYQERLRQLILQDVEASLELAARHLGGLKNLRRFPKELWAGSGGNYLSRIFGLEAIRRGAKVVRFSHAGVSSALVEKSDFSTLLDFCVSDEYVLPTKAYADLLGETNIFDHALCRRDMKFIGLDGDPTFQSISRTRKSPSHRPKVLYVPTLFRNTHQYLISALSDPVYLAWQFRLVEKLLRLPIELQCKPHPEGILGGLAHPLREIAPASEASFELLLDESDVFILDCFNTTTMCQVMCTGKPIVFVELIGLSLREEIMGPFYERCRVIFAQEDENNVPNVDDEQLADAVLSPQENIDPGFFRRLLAGQD